MYRSTNRLVIFDLDGTLVDSFYAVELAFQRHGMDLGDLRRFQRRRKLLKYVGGLREFPKNLRKQLSKENREQIKHTLTEIYRNEARVFPAMSSLLQMLIETPDIRVGVVSRNVTVEPEETVRQVLRRNGIDCDGLDFLECIPLGEDKADYFRTLRERYSVNPSRSYACGDEYRDYAAAIRSGIVPFVVSYGFEDHERLVSNYGIPEEVISRSPRELMDRVCHTLDLASPGLAVHRSSAPED